MHSQSPICQFTENEIEYRGYDVSQLLGQHMFSEMIVLLLTGQMPKDFDRRPDMIEALLVAWVDHGAPPPSTQAVRLAASVGTPFMPAAMSGFLMFGWDHAPIDAACALLEACVASNGADPAIQALLDGYKLPGFGHPVHTVDPRSGKLLQLAVDFEIHSHACQMIGCIESILAASNRKVCANLAGVTAAIWIDMGFNRESVGLIALAGRAVGMAAHHSEVVRSGSKFLGTP